MCRVQLASPDTDSQNRAANRLELLEKLSKAAGDQLRLRILQVLKNDAFGVLELCTLFDIKQSAMSHHLKVLTNAGMVNSRREGNSLFYRRALIGSGVGSALVAALFSELDQQDLSEELRSTLDRAQQIRAQRSRQFFTENAHRFKAQQELISHIDDYRDAINEIIDAHSANKQCALEIGPGQGEYLADLASRYQQLIALDNAATMLSNCEQRCEELGLDNIRFILGDTGSLASSSAQSFSGPPVSEQPVKADCIVANMVLHHNARPEALVLDAASALNDKGILVITELCEHEQDWVRDAAGDVWLGFPPEQLDNWARAAKLDKGPCSYTALRNGFRIQVQSYLKTGMS